MAINTMAEMTKAINKNAGKLILYKTQLTNQSAFRYCSLWTAGGAQTGFSPGTTTPAVTTNATTGAIRFENQVAPATTYVSKVSLTSSVSGCYLELHDRIAHNSNLALNTTALQTITGYNLETLAPSAERIGESDYSDVQWWLEVYIAGGATASNATINVTYNDDTTGNLNVLAVGSTIRQGHMFGLRTLIPAAKQGFNIKGVNSIQLSASTGTAGSVGFTVTKPRTVFSADRLNYNYTYDWSQLGFPEIANDSCLQLIQFLSSGTSSGTLSGTIELAQG